MRRKLPRRSRSTTKFILIAADIGRMPIHELSDDEAAKLKAWVQEGQKPTDWPFA